MYCSSRVWSGPTIRRPSTKVVGVLVTSRAWPSAMLCRTNSWVLGSAMHAFSLSSAAPA